MNNKRKEGKRKRDERNASIFTLVFFTLSQISIIIQDFTLLVLTVSLFVVILYMDSKAEKAAMRYEKRLSMAYDKIKETAETVHGSAYEQDKERTPDISVTVGGKIA